MREELVYIANIWTPYRSALVNELRERAPYSVSAIYLSASESRRRWTVPTLQQSGDGDLVLTPPAGSSAEKPFPLCGSLLRVLQARKPHVVIVTGYGSPCTLLALAWARANRARCFVWDETIECGKREESPVVRHAKRALARASTGVLVPGELARRYQEVALGVPPALVSTVGDSVATEDFLVSPDHRRAARARLGVPRGSRVFLFVGRLEPEKGVHYLLQAFRHIAVRDPVLLLAGGTVPPGSLAPSVRPLGFVAPESMPEVYASADVFVFPTLGDVGGLAVNEALAAGLPVVCSRFAGCVADLVKRPSGIVVDPSDVPALRRAMAAAADTDHLEVRREHALSVSQSMTLASTAERMIEVAF